MMSRSFGIEFVHLMNGSKEKRQRETLPFFVLTEE